MFKRNSIRKLLHFVESVGLGLILIATIVAVGQEVMVMIRAQIVTLGDLLLLFIYLEVVAMLIIYFENHQLPVRYPLYIAIVALARYVILEAKSISPLGLLAVGGTILLLTFAVFMVRYGHVKYPYPPLTPRKDDETLP